MTDDSNQNNLPGFLRDALESSNEAQLITALEFLLEPYFHSGFRAARTQNHEIAAFLAMRALEAVTDNEDEYELMLRLRITRMKAT